MHCNSNNVACSSLIKWRQWWGLWSVSTKRRRWTDSVTRSAVTSAVVDVSIRHERRQRNYRLKTTSWALDSRISTGWQTVLPMRLDRWFEFSLQSTNASLITPPIDRVFQDSPAIHLLSHSTPKSSKWLDGAGRRGYVSNEWDLLRLRMATKIRTRS